MFRATASVRLRLVPGLAVVSSVVSVVPVSLAVGLLGMLLSGVNTWA